MLSEKKILFINVGILVFLVLASNFLGWEGIESSIPFAEKKNDVKIRNGGIPVLVYHKIDPSSAAGGLGLRVPVKKFEWQMSYLKKNGYHTISVDGLVYHLESGKPLLPKSIIISFDDGYENNYTYAFPVLKKYGFTGIVFVVVGTINSTNKFDSLTQPQIKMLTWPEIKEMAAYGITIGSHTVSHLHLGELKPEEVLFQLQNSKALLEKGLGREVKYFSYPYGSYNNKVTLLVKESGYQAAFTMDQGVNRVGADLYRLKRIRITGYCSNEEFIRKLNKYYL